MEEAKFQRQSKLGIITSSNLELPKLSERTFSQLFTCLGFLDKVPTCAVITPPGFKILFKPFIFFAARSMQNWSSLRSTKILSYLESLTFLILSNASPQYVFTLLFAFTSPHILGRCFWHTFTTSGSVSYTHLTLPTTPYV